MEKDASGIREVHDLMADLRDAWATIEGTRNGADRRVSAGVNLAG